MKFHNLSSVIDYICGIGSHVAILGKPEIYMVCEYSNDYEWLTIRSIHNGEVRSYHLIQLVKVMAHEFDKYQEELATCPESLRPNLFDYCQSLVGQEKGLTKLVSATHLSKDEMKRIEEKYG